MASSGGGSGFSLASPGYVEVLTSAGGPFENTQGTLLASALRSATTNTPQQTNYNARGVVVFLNVTANAGTSPTLSTVIRAYDPISGNTRALVTGGNVTGVGTYAFLVYPAAGTLDTQTGSNLPLPRTWDVNFVLGGSAGPSFTYSAAYAYIL